VPLEKKEFPRRTTAVASIVYSIRFILLLFYFAPFKSIYTE